MRVHPHMLSMPLLSLLCLDLNECGVFPASSLCLQHILQDTGEFFIRLENVRHEPVLMPAEGEFLLAIASCCSFASTRHDLLSAWLAIIVSWRRNQLQAYLLSKCVLILMDCLARL